MNAVLQDVRYGLRMMAATPLVTAVAVLALALGIGANTAIFSAVYAVLLRPLPYPHAERLVDLSIANAARGARNVNVSFPVFDDWRAQATTLDRIAAYSNWSMNIGGDQPERLQAMVVTPGFFDVFGASALLGSATLSEDRSVPPGVVISYAFWQRHFGGDPGIVGRSITLDRQPATVLGVMPPAFNYRSGVEVWASLLQKVDDATLHQRGSQFLNVVGRLRDGAAVAQARAEFATIGARLSQQYPNYLKNWTVEAEPLSNIMVGDARAPLLALLGAVAFVLLIACANLANLLLARARARLGELTVRAALGATRGRLVRQLLTESLLLAAIGGGLGVLTAAWGMDTLRVVARPLLPSAFPIHVDLHVLAFAAGLSLLTAVAFGLAPALTSSRAALAVALRQHSDAVRGGGHRLRGVLVAAEIALSLMLLIGGGLLLKSFLRLRAVDPGFVPQQRLAFSIAREGNTYAGNAAAADFFLQVQNRLAQLPRVQSVSAASTLPEVGDQLHTSFTVRGRRFDPTNLPQAEKDFVLPGFFSTMGIPLLQGREFTAHDGAGDPAVALVNREFVRRYFPGEDPIGKVVENFGPKASAATIVGIVGDVRHDMLELPPAPAMYFPVAQWGYSFLWYVVRTDAPLADVTAEVRREVAAVDKEQPIARVHTFRDILDNSTADRRFTSSLMGVFAGLALLLAAIGVYSVMAYSVTQRTHEIGVRMALGASRRDILRLVLAGGTAITAAGIGVGTVLAAALTQLLKGMLYAVSPTDPVTFAAVAVLVAALAVLATYLPARRAMQVDPMVALRYE